MAQVDTSIVLSLLIIAKKNRTMFVSICTKRKHPIKPWSRVQTEWSN